MNRKTMTLGAAGLLAIGISTASLVATAANAAPETVGPDTAATAFTDGPSATTRVSSDTPLSTTRGQKLAPAVAKYGQPGRETLGLAPSDDPANVPYNRCTADQAGPATTSTTVSGSLTHAASPAEAAKADRIEQYCAPLAPKPAWELDRANPDSRAFADRVVAELRAAGVSDVEATVEAGSDRVAFAFGGANNDDQSIQLGLELLPKAELAAAGR